MSDNIDTHNWHVVAAITYDEVNKAIADQKSYPSTLQMKSADGTAEMNVTCGPWSLTTGGSGPNLMINVPITGGTVVFGGQTYPVTAAQTTFKVYANYFPHDPNSPDGPKKNLMLSQTEPGTGNKSSATKPTPAQSNFMVQAALTELLNEFVVAKVAEFAHVFSVVDLEADFSQQKQLAWMSPWYLGYACVEHSQNPTTANSVFGVLTLVDKPAAKADQDALIKAVSYSVDLGAIPDGKDGGLVLSPPIFMKHMMLPAVPYMFAKDGKPASADSFTIDNDGTRISNTDQVTIHDMKLEDGNIVNPTVEKGLFTLELSGQLMKVSASNITFPGGMGITIKINYSNTMVCSLHEDKTLKLDMVNQASGGEVETDKGMDIANIVLGAVAIVASIVAAGAGTVVKSATAAIETATTAAIEAAEATGDAMPLASEVSVTACRGLISGTAESIGTLSSRLTIVCKVALAAAFVGGTTSGIYSILKGVAGGDAKSALEMSDFITAAVDKVVKFQSIPEFEVSSAEFKGAMLFGLTYKS